MASKEGAGPHGSVHETQPRASIAGPIHASAREQLSTGHPQLKSRGKGQQEVAAEGLWNDVSARLREALNDTTFQTWFGEVVGAGLDEEVFAVVCPNDFTR